MLGVKGSLIGGGLAMLLFAVIDLGNAWLAGTAAGDQFVALFGAISVGWLGYALALAQAVPIALVTAIASRVTVKRTLAAIS
jgi:cell division transport system permease protein